MTDQTPEVALNDAVSFLDIEPTTAQKSEMRRTSKTPSQWLQLLCQEWAIENPVVVNDIDEKFLNYKKYLKGQLSAQLLCRLSIDSSNAIGTGMEGTKVVESLEKRSTLNFWQIMGVEDEFDQNYIIAQVERFCQLYSIRGGMGIPSIFDENGTIVHTPLPGTPCSPMDIAMTPTFPLAPFPPGWSMESAQAAAAAAAVAATADTSVRS